MTKIYPLSLPLRGKVSRRNAVTDEGKIPYAQFCKKTRGKPVAPAPLNWLGQLDSNQRNDGVKVRCLTTWRWPSITERQILAKICRSF